MTPQDMIDIDDEGSEMFIHHANLGTVETETHQHTRNQ